MIINYKRLFTIIFTVWFLNSCSVNKQMLNDKLIKELTYIKKTDQNLRKLFIQDISIEERKKILSEFNISEKDFELRDSEILKEYDNLNLKRVEKILSKYGYPRKKNIGDDLSNVVWLVIQHSELSIIEKYFPIIEKANISGDLEYKYIALMKDRILMYQGKNQIFGTQIVNRFFLDPITRKEIGRKDFIWPIQDWNKVNELRKKAGFKDSIEVLAKSIGIEKKYYNLTLKYLDENTINESF